MIKLFTFLMLTGYALTAVSQTANFTFESTTGSFCAPATIRFTSTASGNPTGYVWIFGNNTGSNSGNPTTRYLTAGTFTVRLIVIYKKNTVQVTKTIVIHPAVVPGFTYDRNDLCTPGTVNFRANVPGSISSYQWNFDDGTAVISTTSQTISHYFSNYRSYSISLKATSTTGCSAQSFTSIIVQRPVIAGAVTPASGCIPASVSFNATVSLPALSAVSTYKWDFGDGTVQITTAVGNTNHTYNTAGTFIPKLQIVTNDGCSNDFILQRVAFGFPPTNHVAYPKKQTFCGSESAFFVSKAVNANKYFWDFGEGDTTSVTDTVMQHKFKTLGTKTVTVTPFYNDCPGTPISFSVNVIGVIAGYKYANTCSNKNVFTFTNITQGNQSAIAWNYGDGSPILNTPAFTHSYPDTGTFLTSLYVTDNITGCSDTYSKSIYTAIPSLLNPDSSICRNSNTTFSIPDNYNNPVALYNWQVVGLQSGPGNTVPFTINANVHGHFSNNFVVIDNGPQYCPDTIRLRNNIIVRGPILDFTAPAEICLAKTYPVQNTSRPFIPEDLINVWDWDYGIPGESDSVFQPQPYLYPYWGTAFQVKLTAIDIRGCMDTLVKSVTVFDIPFLRSIPDRDTLCAGKTDTLIVFHNDPIIWSPVNLLSCSTCDTIIVTPSVTTTYYVKATNRFNCTVTDSIPIYVYPRFTAIAAKKDNYICLNESIQLEVNPPDKKVSWFPGVGLSDTTIFNPIASPKHSSSYEATLTDSAGCFSSSTNINVFVKSLPTIDAGTNRTYPYNTAFILNPTYSPNSSSYLWTPADLLDCNTCPNPNGIASASREYFITVKSDSGCIASDKVSIFVECKDANLLLPTAFTPNNDNLNDYYYPIARGIKRIIRFVIYNREGQLVYEASNFDPNHRVSGWDGRLKGMPQNSATYVYSIEAICEAGEKIVKKGSFILLR